MNLYEGLADRLGILKLLHAPRRYDPLIQYVPYPLSKEDLYVSLLPNLASPDGIHPVIRIRSDEQIAP